MAAKSGRSRVDAAPEGTVDGGSERQKSRSGRIGAFVNSPFGLWLLSTIFISVGSWAFTEWRESREALRSRQERIARLDLEITNRLDQGDQGMRGPPSSNMGEPDGEALATLPAHVLLAPERSQQLFPEYRSWGLRALLAELYSLFDVDSVDAHCVEKAMIAQREFQLRWLQAPLAANREDEFRRDLGRIADFRWSWEARQARLRTSNYGGLEKAGTSDARPYCEERPLRGN